MSDCERVTALIDEYVEGRLATEATLTVERHLQTCAMCQREVDDLHALLRRLKTLPRSIDPPATVWRAIGSRLDAEMVRPLAGRLSRWQPYQLAVAALLLVAITAGSTALLMRHGIASGVAADGAVLTGGQFEAVEAGYVTAARDLEAAYRGMRDEMRPEVRALVERNLAVIDAAIAETRAALMGNQPAPDLERLLWASYRTKLDLLGRATRL